MHNPGNRFGWVCDKFVGNDRSNEPRRGEIFIVQMPKKWTGLRRSVMAPRWGLERQEGRRLSTKIPPLRGSMRFKRHRTAFQGNDPQICRTPGVQLDIKGL